MKFKKEFMQLLISEDLNNDADANVVEDEFIEEQRKANLYRVIFRVGNKFYSSSYTSGEDTRPYEFEEDEISCQEVHQVEKMVKVWEEVK